MLPQLTRSLSSFPDGPRSGVGVSARRKYDIGSCQGSPCHPMDKYVGTIWKGTVIVGFVREGVTHMEEQGKQKEREPGWSDHIWRPCSYERFQCGRQYLRTCYCGMQHCIIVPAYFGNGLRGRLGCRPVY